ncbi:MAG: SDR family oxidoreductase [Pseudomonadales bacterium]|nr:SDR family oxidoreductase [Pseudomonadales bacterium]MBO6563438.1 SDR family oxidoreductase [Pseudomonadales bacterium]MBO6595753.1 SDR family oxidoreductase [Pseudomonadales bacterium]MBO6702253.1 SDR family oxidoreductase [Pseudomonadales bacterium]MBO6820689.1 SDR family oxidoreductase [Pseudomonadales bacterium]
MEIAGKLVVVTGAASGIGRALASRFAEEGARHVVCADRDEEYVEETATMIGDAASSVLLDVADQQAIETLVSDLEASSGGIDIFVSNAGYARGGGLGLPSEDWKRMMEVHTWSHLYAAQAVIPKMIERGGGYLLNTSSAAGLLTQFDSGPYAVSKHASVALAEWLAINYQSRGIGVSVLCPQAVRTRIMGKRGKATEKDPGSNQAALDGILEPAQVAADCIEAIREEKFLVLPHPEVAKYFRNKANDYDRWLDGMRRFRDKVLDRQAKRSQ